ncbi:MAG TPA: DUF881 domain-containing protein [Segeticoccus sp.]|uniref:DUF881 domain-containing protein n=1 Tax=Segeticoccus sp. TaxID=2706531 RepID=UPI002D7F42D2|nr:DUF881 domain-containing protein [Segeticoccus sp.]HET8599617.1 DUF881 domain-containing protein [Segeticoccus sp.]
MPDTPPPPKRPSAWQRLIRMGRPRATKANALAAALAVLLGFAIVTQVHQTQSEGLESLRQADLVSLLDDVTQRSSKLDQELNQLQRTKEQLSQGQGDQTALRAARQRLQSLQILTGTVAAKGPGIQLTIKDRNHRVTAPVVLDAVEELRDAGAEAIQIGPVRVVASTWFGMSGRKLQVDGVTVDPPYDILVIGDPHTLSAAMDIPGGVSETVRQLGAQVSIRQSKRVEIDALQTASKPRYARPVPSASPSTS